MWILIRLNSHKILYSLVVFSVVNNVMKIPMTKSSNPKHRYDLEERPFHFAKNVAALCKKLPKTISTTEYVKQVVKASGSVGVNYIEANNALNKKILFKE